MHTASLAARYGLEEIVDGVQFEGLDGVFVEAVQKTILGRREPSDLTTSRPSAPGILTVEENGVRPQFGDLLDGFFTVAGLAHDDHITIAGQQFSGGGCALTPRRRPAGRSSRRSVRLARRDQQKGMAIENRGHRRVLVAANVKHPACSEMGSQAVLDILQAMAGD